MSIQILTPIELPVGNRLDRVFNSYLHGLRSLERVLTPSLSMAAYDAMAAEDTTNDTQEVPEMGAMFRYLAVLTTSLHQLADNLRGAYEDLEIFATEGANLELFARYKLDEAAQQAGRTSKRPSDWQAKPKSLAPFQLHAVLARYFVSSPGLGEKIGTSQAIHFAYYSGLLRNELAFDLRDPSQPASPQNFTTRTPADRAALQFPADQPDERWAECDVSLSGSEVVVEFEAMLKQCQEAAALYHSLAADDVAGFKQLFRLLVHLVDGDGEYAAEILSHVPA